MTGSLADGQVPGSFRDPSGFVYFHGGSVYRQVHADYKRHYDHLMNSGLYKALVNTGLLIPHEEADISFAATGHPYRVIKPEPIPFISYPYEWCFSQLKHAALVTLDVQMKSLEYGMSLKDCSAFNIQFQNGKPLLIDTLSFEEYLDGTPWVAYRQFCQHFVAPLALMCYRDVRLSQLLRIYLDGIPLRLASSLLPLYTHLTFFCLSHIHLHAKSQEFFSNKEIKIRKHRVGRLSFTGLIDNLRSGIRRLTLGTRRTEWSDYYAESNYSSMGLEHKKQIISEFLDRLRPTRVWDLGGNVGVFSRLASSRGAETVSFDADPIAVEKNYVQSIQDGDARLLPLVMDFTNPSSDIGWGLEERESIVRRGPADTVLMLALIHHLAISNNVPLNVVARFLSSLCHSLIIEFVPKDDSNVQRLLASREDIFPHYTQKAFETAFTAYFSIERTVRIVESKRTLWLMIKKRG